MFTKRNALTMGMLFLLLFTAACGAAAPKATEAPASPPNDSKYYPPAEEPAAPLPAPAGTAYSPEASAPLSAPQSSSQNWGVPPSKSQPGDTFFEDYGVNPFIDVEDDNLSTFALDVDTGSYSIMRSYLRDGIMPPSMEIAKAWCAGGFG